MIPGADIEDRPVLLDAEPGIVVEGRHLAVADRKALVDLVFRPGADIVQLHFAATRDLVSPVLPLEECAGARPLAVEEGGAAVRILSRCDLSQGQGE
jgi:hypothetical protein